MLFRSENPTRGPTRAACRPPRRKYPLISPRALSLFPSLPSPNLPSPVPAPPSAAPEPSAARRRPPPMSPAPEPSAASSWCSNRRLLPAHGGARPTGGGPSRRTSSSSPRVQPEMEEHGLLRSRPPLPATAAAHRRLAPPRGPTDARPDLEVHRQTPCSRAPRALF